MTRSAAYLVSCVLMLFAASNDAVAEVFAFADVYELRNTLVTAGYTADFDDKGNAVVLVIGEQRHRMFVGENSNLLIQTWVEAPRVTLEDINSWNRDAWGYRVYLDPDAHTVVLESDLLGYAGYHQEQLRAWLRRFHEVAEDFHKEIRDTN